MAIKDRDASYPRASAERMIGARAGLLSLDELAKRVSETNTAEPVSVRDITSLPISHSKVYLKGEATGDTPYLKNIRL